MVESKSWNALQGEIFKQAYKRARRAVNDGFYLEGVCLAESLILNRLEVVLRSSSGIEYDKFSVGKAINNIISNKVHAFNAQLWEDCSLWSKKRNMLSHHFAQVSISG